MRWHTLTFPELQGSTTMVRFDFENQKGHDEMQLGEIIFYQL